MDSLHEQLNNHTALELTKNVQMEGKINPHFPQMFGINFSQLNFFQLQRACFYGKKKVKITCINNSVTLGCNNYNN